MRAASGRQTAFAALAGWIITAAMFFAGVQTSLAQDDPAPETSAAAASMPSDYRIEYAERMPLADRALLTDLAEGDQRIIAVGEHGNILVSEPHDAWRQADTVPTRVLLTGVDAVGSQAWAVGHDQTILHSDDGGLTWELQYAAPYNPENIDDVANGAPLLDVLFVDAQRGFAVGAYGLMLRTDNGGVQWERVSLADASMVTDDVSVALEPGDAEAEEAEIDAEAEVAIDEDDSWTFSEDELALEELTDPHLNAIARVGSDALLIVAERGAVYRSRDDGDTWERLTMPYAGSMFGVIGYPDGRVLAFGLRGNAFESSDLGTSWQRVDTGTELSLQGGTAYGNGGAVLVGNNGLVLLRRDASSPFAAIATDDGGVLADALPQNGEIIVVGENGVRRIAAH